MAGETKITLSSFMDKLRTGLLMGAAILVVITIFELGRSIYDKLKPVTTAGEEMVYPAADVKFGGLPAISFPAQTSASRPQSYDLAIAGVDLQTNTGWPTFGEPSNIAGANLINVYKMKVNNLSLTAEEKARNIAENLGFEDNPQILDARTYLFTYPGPPLKENLQIDLKTMFMTLKTDYLAVNNIFAITQTNGEKYLPDRMAAIAAVENYLQVAGVMPSDLSRTLATVEYAKSIDSDLELVNNVLEADYLTVNLPRQPLTGLMNGMATNYNFYGPNNVSSIYGVVGRDYNGQDIVVELEDYYYDLDLNDPATYYLETVANAWQKLQLGEAYVINPRGVKNAVITSVALGYYESHKEQEYLMPVYVFYGENDFMAYVQALHPNMITR